MHVCYAFTEDKHDGPGFSASGPEGDGHDERRCVLGRCADGTRVCGADHQCDAGARCELGVCLDGARGCWRDSDCEASCELGVCVEA